MPYKALNFSGLFILLLASEAFVVQSATLFVWSGSPRPAPPYATWESAAHVIQDAVDASVDLDTVLVTNGVYAAGGRAVDGTMTNRVAVDRRIHLRSVNGPEVTIIEGAPSLDDEADRLGNGTGAVRGVYLGSGAILDGFTVTNGHTLTSWATPYGRGGGAWCESSAILTNCLLTANAAYNDGGGVYQGTLLDCRITHNEVNAERDGDGGGADHSTLIRCIISGNRARKGGGVDNSTLFACVLTDNKARVFGGGAARSTLYHCTVTRNSSRVGGGVSGYFRDTSAVYNSIIFDNDAVLEPNYDRRYTTLRYSCTSPLPSSGEGNILADPLLSSYSHLSMESPCRGAGSDLYVMGVDIDGESWSSPPSMGADELILGAATGALHVAIEAEFTELAVGFSARFEGIIGGQATDSYWLLGDGITVRNRMTTDHAWLSPGNYDVQLIAINDANPSGVVATVSVNVVEPDISYVKLHTPLPTPPYSTWETAATNIQDAIDAGHVAGRVVLVDDGIYDIGGVAVDGTMTNRVALLNAVTVRSVNGPATTIIRGSPASSQSHGDGAIRGAYVGQGSVLDGFTLTNGYTRRDAGHRSREQGGGGAWCARRGVVTNCVFSGNHAYRDGGGVNGGIIHGSLFMGNQAEDQGGAADDAVLYDCLIAGNSALNSGGGVSESLVHRSVVRNNMAGNGAGAIYSKLDHCLLQANEGSIYTAANYIEMMHCTVVGHQSGQFFAVGGGLVENSILVHNAIENVTFFDTEIRHSCLPVNPPGGIGNITDAPLFIDYDGDNLRLRPESPCVDAAAGTGTPDTRDLDGKPRSMDGNGDGVRKPDMGAYELGVSLEMVRRRDQTILYWVESPGESYTLEETPTPSPPAFVPSPSGTANPVMIDTLENSRFYRLAPLPRE